MEIDLEAIYRVFLHESQENLDTMEQVLLELEQRPQDGELLQTVFRVAHTLKGDAANLGIQVVADFAHVVEDLLERIRDGAVDLDRPVVTLLLRSVDALRCLVREALDGRGAHSAGEVELLERIRQLSGGHPGRARRAQGAARGERAAPSGAWPDTRRGRTLRVDVAKLDRLLALIGEFSLARGRVRRLLEQGMGGPLVLDVHREADRIFLGLQEQVLDLRMVPIETLFRQYARVVRDLAEANGKQARLVVEGGDVELDTALVDHLRDPLTHMVRNAVDHGIETPDVRRRSGKPEIGVIVLRAAHEAGGIVVQVADDGAGISRSRVLERARERNLVADGADLDDEALFGLIFEAGLTTASRVTELSGRGIGMDVVRREIESLRGTISVSSQEGLGTTFTIRLPLTLAIINGFSVAVGSETFVIPLDSVTECLALPADRHDEGLDGVFNLRGEALPFLRLGALFGLAGSGAGKREGVVVVQHGERRAGLVVDAFQGESQAVIKPLGKIFEGIAGIAGSTILGSGRVALILDVPHLIGRATAGHARRHMREGIPG